MIASHPHVQLRRRHYHRLSLAGASTALVCGLSIALVVSGSAANAAAADVPLASTAQFAVLAGSGVSNTGPTTVTGDVGSFPTTSISGAGPGADSITTTGTIRGGDAVVQGAKSDLVAAYNTAAGQLPPTATLPDLAGQRLVAGVYKASSSLQLTGTVTLDGQGDPASVFVFQVPSAFTTASRASVSLVNGAQACHVYWQIGSSATFGTGTAFKGNVFALTSITATTGATFEGRLLARDGAVTLDTNTITLPSCAPVVTTPAPTTATPAPTTSAPVVPTPGSTTATPKPTRSSPSGSGDDSDSDGGDSDADGSGGGDADGSSSSTSTDTGTGTGTSTGLPDTGGPSALLVPLGVATLVVGSGLAFAARRQRGAHRG